ncbi:MAG: SidE phosphodiesterase domain-containing protein [Coxiellaceae bacterium]|nr:SidE phosphodiesterase domain-containing protein [Coxiellaceae bacterium]
MGRIERLAQGPARKNQALCHVEEILNALLTDEGRIRDGVRFYIDRTVGHFKVRVPDGYHYNLSLALKYANFEYFFINAEMAQRCKRYLHSDGRARVSRAGHLVTGISGRPIFDVEEVAVATYTRNDYYPYINAMLRGQVFESDDVVLNFVLAMLTISTCNKNIDSKAASERYCYRVEKKKHLPVVMREYVKPGKVYKRNGLISTTTDEWLEHERFISGHQRSIRVVSEYGAEREILYPPSYVRVVKGADGLKAMQFVTGVALARYDHYEVELALADAYQYLRMPYQHRREKKYGIERPYHALAHHVRGVCMADMVVAYFKSHAKSSGFREYCERLSAEELTGIKILLAFCRTGRQSEISFNDDPRSYKIYLQNSAANMKEFLVNKLQWTAKKADFYADILTHMGDPEFKTRVTGSAACKQYKGFINSIAMLVHNLDLPRCYSAAKWNESLAIYGMVDNARSVVARSAAQQRDLALLQHCSADLLSVTGDQLLFSIGATKAKGIDRERFVQCNHNIEECYGHCSSVVEAYVSQLSESESVSAEAEAGNEEKEIKPAVEELGPAKYGGGAEPVKPKPSQSPSSLFAKKVPDLFRAILENKIVLLRSLMVQGANINQPDSKGVTPLMLACSLGRMGIAKTLILGGADVHLIDGAGNNALSYAIKEGRMQLTKLLKKEGATPSHGAGPSYITIGL